MITALVNCTIVSEGKQVTDKAVLLEGELISNVVAESEIPPGCNLIDLNGAYLAPGLIDLQIYGSGKKLFGGNPSEEALLEMETQLLQQGCTGFLATVATNTSGVVEQAIASAKAYRKKAIGNFLGLHLEGPYLNTVRKGAHPENLIKKGNIDEVKRWIDNAAGEIKMMTIAPELQDEAFIYFLNEQGIIVSAGHSDATYDEATNFFEHSIKAVTHLYNAMPPMHHRDPGVIAAIFEAKPYTSIVADGIHVNFPMIRLAKRELGEKLFLITDAVTETRKGLYPHIFKDDRYVMPDGTLSGSCLSMLQAVANCVQQAAISLPEAVQMATAYPASLIGLQEERGKIAPGVRADLLCFTAGFSVKRVYLGGKPADTILNRQAN